MASAVFKTVEGSKGSWLVRFLPTPPFPFESLKYRSFRSFHQIFIEQSFRQAEIAELCIALTVE